MEATASTRRPSMWIFVEPEEGVGDEEVLNFVAAVVVDQRAPVGMRALPRIFMFVEMRAVEEGEAVSVARKVRRSPIEEDAEAGLVAAINKFHEVCGRAESAGGGEIAKGLIAPRTVVGMLHDGEQFDVGVAKAFHVGNELVGEFAVAEPAIAIFRDAPPRAEMNFVDTDGGVQPVFAGRVHSSRRNRSNGAYQCERRPSRCAGGVRRRRRTGRL